MNRLIISTLSFLLIPMLASAADFACSTHPAKNTADSALPSQAKISKADAEKAALANIKASSTIVKDGELEVEHGCLLYSFDIKVSGKSGIEEVMVDAGTGKILSHTHESPKAEAAETAQDKATLKKTK